MKTASHACLTCTVTSGIGERESIENYSTGVRTGVKVAGVGAEVGIINFLATGVGAGVIKFLVTGVGVGIGVKMLVWSRSRSRD